MNRRFMNDVTMTSSNDELQQVVERYRIQYGELQDAHLAERQKLTDKLRRAVRKQKHKQIDADWAEV